MRKHHRKKSKTSSNVFQIPEGPKKRNDARLATFNATVLELQLNDSPLSAHLKKQNYRRIQGSNVWHGTLICQQQNMNTFCTVFKKRQLLLRRGAVN